MPHARRRQRRLAGVPGRALVQRRRGGAVFAGPLRAGWGYQGFPVYRDKIGGSDDLWVAVVKDGPLAPYAAAIRHGGRYNRPHMLRILVTNDDGYRSAGIHALADALREIGDVTIVAPTTEASAIGHALTLRRPLRLETIEDRVFAVDGTPTDCVNVAVTQVFDGLPDLVVSGINKGWNLGDDVTYSGTVAGALEGALLGIPSIGVSLRQTRGDYDFSTRRAPRR